MSIRVSNNIFYFSFFIAICSCSGCCRTARNVSHRANTSRYTCLHTCLQTCLQTCLHTCLHTCLNTCPHTCLHTSPHKCPRTCPHTRLHTCLHTCASTPPGACVSSHHPCMARRTRSGRTRHRCFFFRNISEHADSECGRAGGRSRRRRTTSLFETLPMATTRASVGPSPSALADGVRIRTEKNKSGRTRLCCHRPREAAASPAPHGPPE